MMFVKCHQMIICSIIKCIASWFLHRLAINIDKNLLFLADFNSSNLWSHLLWVSALNTATSMFLVFGLKTI